MVNRAEISPQFEQKFLFHVDELKIFMWSILKASLDWKWKTAHVDSYQKKQIDECLNRVMLN